MTKQDIIEIIAENAETSKNRAEAAYEAMIHEIIEELKANKQCRIPGLLRIKVGKEVVAHGFIKPGQAPKRYHRLSIRAFSKLKKAVNG